MAEEVKRYYETFVVNEGGAPWSVVSIPTKYIKTVRVTEYPANAPSEALIRRCRKFLRSTPAVHSVSPPMDFGFFIDGLEGKKGPQLPPTLLTEPLVMIEHSPAGAI